MDPIVRGYITSSGYDSVCSAWVDVLRHQVMIVYALRG